jgi:hypothetical protein
MSRKEVLRKTYKMCIYWGHATRVPVCTYVDMGYKHLLRSNSGLENSNVFHGPSPSSKECLIVLAGSIIVSLARLTFV